MHFGSAAAAQADLSLRRSLARAGISQPGGTPYSRLFSVQSASVVGSNLALRLRPTNNQPGIYLQLVYDSDMVFAMCP